VKFTRPRLAAALTPAAIGAAAALVAALVGGGTQHAAASSAPASRLAPAVATAASGPVLVTCTNKERREPATFVLACADYNSALIHLNWQSWGAASAQATGAWHVNDCVPNCALGTFINYPALVVAWRPAPLPKHPGTRYFTRLTVLLPGRHCFTAGGRKTCYPTTATTDLWPSLG